ncbi:bifunctional glutamate N-acetyltransferase/amino-acid acetyltransferase ArgJ [Candidatus Pelagibacter communis]|uniref:bifunctional glutamate N-acetyltransferase/amino-acid acetyltransferase ArgJ n=1 Tax=Pelagibacter ubique TaxID=198252 RepID=UPI00094CE4CE|nr:bifunctional glutamate N-acetyltransferase/amino-acid acetyltransferase ArgJ [Candidatus Pelagibacter ubique]
MAINLSNFLISKKDRSKMADFQDLDHIDGLSISVTSANLYNTNRDDLVLFYFRDGAEYASVYTQSKVISENIKWNLSIKGKKIKALIVNARNANCLTGTKGYNSLKEISEETARLLTLKQKSDEDNPVKITSKDIIFGCTGTIGEPFPLTKIKSSIKDLVEKIKYTQNKYLWIKSAMSILTTDLKPKLAMEECKIGNTKIKIYGIAKGSGMIFPNMATTLAYIFTDANLSSGVLQKILKKNINNTFNAISCDGDTSTNDMITIFSTGKSKNKYIKNINDPKLKEFDRGVNSVLLNLAKRVVSDGEGASKFIQIDVLKCKNEEDAKKIAFSIANSPLVKTAIAGEDPNWGRIMMAAGKKEVEFNINSVNLMFGDYKVFEKGQVSKNYSEQDLKEYMKNETIKIILEINSGKKHFTCYTMDFTKKYIEINSDYRS